MTPGATVMVWRFCRGAAEARVEKVAGKIVTVRNREGAWTFRKNTRGTWCEVYQDEDTGRWIECGGESATMTLVT
jgi:hypothetical protein